MENKYRYTSEWTKNLERELHWRWYWHQLKLMEGRINPDARIAEIGVGSGFTYNYLKSKGFNIKSIDIDKDKKPDLLENIVTCPDEFLKFDVILAFNVFEHIPYLEFIQTIEKFSRNKIKQLFIGLPLNKKIIFELKFRLGRFINKTLTIQVPKKKITTPFHHWEPGFENYTTTKIVDDFKHLHYDLEANFEFKLQSYFYFKLANEK